VAFLSFIRPSKFYNKKEFQNKARERERKKYHLLGENAPKINNPGSHANSADKSKFHRLALSPLDAKYKKGLRNQNKLAARLLCSRLRSKSSGGAFGDVIHGDLHHFSVWN
jgi:hypothetical protein